MSLKYSALIEYLAYMALLNIGRDYKTWLIRGMYHIEPFFWLGLKEGKV